jgi:excisionase family DNA binding protein
MTPQFDLESTNFTVVEAARHLRVSRSFLYKLIAAGSLHPMKIGARTIITGRELKRFVADSSSGN